MAGDDDQHRRKGKTPMTEEQLLKELEDKERRERLSATMQMIGQMTKDDLEKVQNRVGDLLYDIELQPLWEDMHTAMNEYKAEEKPIEKPVEKPVQILQKKCHLDFFLEEKEEENFWGIQGKKMRLAKMAVMKKEYGPHDSDATASEDEKPVVFVEHRSDTHTFSFLEEIIKEFREDEKFGINDALLDQKTDSEADDANEDEEEKGPDEEEDESDDFYSE